MMYRVTYTQGNGYSCGCCRSEDTRTEDFATREELMKWMTEYHAVYLCRIKKPLTGVFNPISTLFWEDADDRDIVDIREIGEDIKEQFKPDDKEVEALLKAKLEVYNEKQKKISEENERKARAQEKIDYERLKEKFGQEKAGFKAPTGETSSSPAVPGKGGAGSDSIHPPPPAPSREA